MISIFQCHIYYIFLMIFLLYRNRLYEVCESSDTDVPESLLSVISKLEDNTDSAHLFLGLVYVLTLESGFEPALFPADEDNQMSGCEQSPITAQQIAKLSIRQQMTFKYDSRKVLRWSKEGLPNSDTTSRHMKKWKFCTGGLGHLILSIEFLHSSSSTLAIVSGLVNTAQQCKQKLESTCFVQELSQGPQTV